MTTKKATEQMVNDLYSLILSLESPEDCRLLFEDLCAYKEIEQMSLRVRAAKLLIEGKTYNQVMDEVEISSATLSRISRCVQYGGGYAKFLKDDSLE